MTDVADHVSGKTGLTLTITLSKAGAAYASITPTVTELGSGVYSIALATGNTGTLGALDMHVTATGADPSDTHDQVVAFDPGDSAALGLSSVSGALTQATTAATQATAANTATGTLLTGQTTILTRIGIPSVSLSADVLTRLAGSAYAAAPTTGQIVTAVKADSQFALLLNSRKQLYNYVPSTKTLTLLNDDGTSTGLTVALTTDSTGQIVARH